MHPAYFRPRQRDPGVDAAAAPLEPACESLLPILQQIQSQKGFVAPVEIAAAADRLKIPPADAYGVASFYSMFATSPQPRRVVRVCDGPVCQLVGCRKIMESLQRAKPEDTRVVRTSCLGLCDRAPAALVDLDPCGPIDPDAAADVWQGHRGAAPNYDEARDGETRVAMERFGRVDPDDVESALAAGAYQSLLAALKRPREEVLREVAASGLQGRGGAGFPTGRKWKMVAEQTATTKYVICNADESEPTAFKDRVLMERDPHLVLEGMLLAGWAVGASEGIVYVRGEYETAARRLERAIDQAAEKKLLGERIGGSDWSFQIRVHRGAGAYICGEETALLESLEGRRGEPRIRPPYPTTHGFRGCPTVVNNVETLCMVPAVVRRGGAWYRSLGTPQSAGTKLLTVIGHVVRPGLFEAPFGITLREVIDRFAGGMRPGSVFHAALTGGAAGTLVGAASLDVPLDFASARNGVSLGAGSIFVVDQTVRVVDLLGWLLRFFEFESCGKCTPCREGTRQARALIDRMRSGTGGAEDVARLRKISRAMRLTSFCGLGQSVAWPVESALHHFPDAFEKGTGAETCRK